MKAYDLFDPMLSTTTRLKLEKLIDRLSNGELVSLEERVNLHKYARRYPMLAGKLHQALTP